MTDGDIKMLRASDGTAEQAELAALIEYLRAATTAWADVQPDNTQAMAMLMGALPLYAGTLFATLAYAGAIPTQAQARIAKSMQHNFREGVKIGMKRAVRIEQEMGLGGNA